MKKTPKIFQIFIKNIQKCPKNIEKNKNNAKNISKFHQKHSKMTIKILKNIKNVRKILKQNYNCTKNIRNFHQKYSKMTKKYF